MKICPMCGNENDDIAKTCTNCGAKLETRPEFELKPDMPKTMPTVEIKKPDDLTNSLNQQNKTLSEQNNILSEMLKHTAIINQKVSAIKGWVTFLGILALIGLIVGFISSCNALMSML